MTPRKFRFILAVTLSIAIVSVIALVAYHYSNSQRTVIAQGRLLNIECAQIFEDDNLYDIRIYEPVSLAHQHKDDGYAPLNCRSYGSTHSIDLWIRESLNERDFRPGELVRIVEIKRPFSKQQYRIELVDEGELEVDRGTVEMIQKCDSLDPRDAAVFVRFKRDWAPSVYFRSIAGRTDFPEGTTVKIIAHVNRNLAWDREKSRYEHGHWITYYHIEEITQH